ncbi:MAG: flagellar motor switch protein FliG [Pseudomonadales bacterium]|nr:flagellar motor switch protein FliG [Pseudomonadales bacterium]MCP5215368.1 flagellar motor switch protein FliG [Pseudomonadales bacterium]
MNEEFNAIESAAILMMSLGEQHAAQILRLMEPKEVQRIGAAMTQLENINKEQVTKVLEGFLEDAQDETGLTTDSDKYIRSMLTQALGSEKANSVIERILMGGDTTGLDTLKWMEPLAVADIIRFEHPQVQAIILSYLDSDQAAGVLALLSEKVRLEIIIRISNLKTVQPSALEELNFIIENQVSTGKTTKTTSLGGTKTAANILNAIDSSIESVIFEQLTGVDEALSSEIQELMFVFENLANVDDRSIQALLREVSSDELIIALKGADEEVQEKIFSNMSKRAAELLKDDLEAKGPVRLSEVEVAQKAILMIARRMAESGEIDLGGGGGDQML